MLFKLMEQILWVPKQSFRRNLKKWTKIELGRLNSQVGGTWES